jgi:hypothetical protein
MGYSKLKVVAWSKGSPMFFLAKSKDEKRYFTYVNTQLKQIQLNADIQIYGKFCPYIERYEMDPKEEEKLCSQKPS